MARQGDLWYPTIFPDKCNGCAEFEKPRCIEFCPNGVFELREDKAIVANPHKCVNGCIACEPVCPKKAISFPQTAAKRQELVSSKDKGLLRKTTCIKCGKIFWTNRNIDLCFDCEK